MRKKNFTKADFLFFSVVDIFAKGN
ncbi:uncharacterized protein METZ01_LOCUS48417 [marine metagenome]|uniref:Uncharacterized protein n=1 Tax=marine metagenome TaxID=408172 RepID=A0A381S337_9ZZZZ